MSKAVADFYVKGESYCSGEVRGYGRHIIKTVILNPGVFLYSGFGLGHYYSKDGNRYWVWTTVSRQMADKEDVQYQYHDVGRE